jgi:hypothetical protein
MSNNSLGYPEAARTGIAEQKPIETIQWKAASKAEEIADSIHTTANDKGKLPEDIAAKSWRNAKSLICQLAKRGANFLHDGGDIYASCGALLIPLDENPNIDELLLGVGLNLTLAEGRTTLKFVQTMARSRANKTSIHRFCANLDGAILVPVQKGTIVVSATGISDKIPEGVIVQPAPSQTPFQYFESATAGFAEFEKLVVQTTATRIPDLAWLIAMNEGAFPFLAREYPTRALTIHSGFTANGKTSGAETFSLLHGFESLTADVSMAALDTKGSNGIVFLDNKETKNITQALEDWFLFASTGGGRERCHRDGKLRPHSSDRPLVVMTSIEGFALSELRNRAAIDIEFALSAEQKKNFGIKDHQTALKKARNAIMSALMHVLAEFKRREMEYTKMDEIPLNFRFGDHYRALCGLLRAYSACANKPAKWADKIIAVWHLHLSEHDTQNEELNFVITRFVGAENRGEGITVLHKDGWELIVLPGAGYFAEWATKRGLEKMVPMPLQRLSTRLAESSNDYVQVIRHSDPWPQTEDIPSLGAWPEAIRLLKRKDSIKPIGFLHRVGSTAEFDDTTIGADQIVQ